jgi:hypothetical protein
MTGAKRFVTACAVAACFVTTAALAADQLVLPARARVGIITMMPADLTHYHVGKSRLGSFMRTYEIGWPVAEVVDNPIAAMLKGMGAEPVFLEPTDELRHEKQSWIVSNPLANKLPRGAEAEIARILEAENLQGLVIVAPGANSNPGSANGDRLKKLPGFVQGWGFSTSDEPDGVANPVVFNLTQMLIIGRGAESPELIFRDWGGAYLDKWAGFNPGPDLKAVPAEGISKFRPVMRDVLQTQIGRLTPRIKVAN